MKILAVIMPFYIVYYWVLHDHSEIPFAKSLWWHTIAGFCIYILSAILYLNLDSDEQKEEKTAAH